MIKSLLKKTLFYDFYIKKRIELDTQKKIELNKRVRGPLIHKYLPKNAIGAELGVLFGNFSKVLLDNSEAKELHLIDPWYFLDSHWHWAGGNTSTVDAICKILKSHKKEIENKRVFVHVQDDLKILKDFPNNYFDWVYIDSSHMYEHTKLELEILHQKVKSEGIIAGDDWNPLESHRHHGVYKAVQEFMKSYNYELIYANEENLQWFIKRKN